jgi:hypothetical protein
MDSTALSTKEQPTPVAQLAEEINEHHRQCEAAMNHGLEHALEAGRLLLEVKKRCCHGDWLPWLKKNFQGSKRTAQAYLRLHREYPQLKRKAQRVALLSMRQAIVNVANDTHVVYRHDEPARGEIIEVWQKEQCQNARRAASRAEVRRTTRAPTPPEKKVVAAEPNVDGDGTSDEDSTTKVARLVGVPVEIVEKGRVLHQSGRGELIEAVERGEMDLDTAIAKTNTTDPEPPEKTAWRFGALIKLQIDSFVKHNPTTSMGLLAIVLHAQAVELEKLAETEADELVDAKEITCPNCGAHEVDDDGDCVQCHEPAIAAVQEASA